MLKRPADNQGIFRNEAGSIKRLRKYYKDKEQFPTNDSLQKELVGESDRAFVLLMGGIIEDALSYRLISNVKAGVYTPEEKARILRYEGPLGTHSARCEVAWLFGFIDDMTYQQLDVLRELRNACAHCTREVSFSLDEFYNVALRMFKPIGHLNPPAKEEVASGVFRNTLLLELVVLQTTLNTGTRDAALRDLSLNPTLSQLVGKATAEQP